MNDDPSIEEIVIDYTPSRNEDEDKGQESQIVSIGVSDRKEEVEFAHFHNDWISLYYDKELVINDSARQLIFTYEEFDISMIIERIEDDRNVRETYIQPLLEKGYELSYEGEGEFILFHYEDRLTFDLYEIRLGEYRCVVYYELPNEERIQDRYLHRFLYMLETIEDSHYHSSEITPS